jgi:uncharacterized protein (DUF952 family)
MIYHISSSLHWENAQKQGFCTADSLQTEGFIHASAKEQVKATLERFFEGETDVIILQIDENKLHSPLKYEPATDIQQDFPHIFGHINLDAVVGILQKNDF